MRFKFLLFYVIKHIISLNYNQFALSYYCITVGVHGLKIESMLRKNIYCLHTGI